MKIVEYQYHGARIIEHPIEEVMSIRATFFCEPIEDEDMTFIGYDYPVVKNKGSLVVHLKNGKTEIYPASNWQIEF